MSTAQRTIKRIRRTWSELDYAQRRLMEIRTGLELTGSQQQDPQETSAEELEQMYAREQPQRAA